MPRRKAVKTLSSDSSDNEPISKKVTKKEHIINDDSSSESDIGNYLQSADKIDLDSPFFNLQKDRSSAFDNIENNIFTGISRLNDSDSNSDIGETSSQPIETSVTSKLNFQQLHEYVKKIEEVRKHAEEYKAKRQQPENNVDISNLLAAGEAKDKQELEYGFHSSDFESEEGWEEVSDKEKEENIIPKEGVQITVEMPGVVKKKKGVDLMAAIKRRINRVRKENQVLIHKVHLLCWIAHGNYLNSVINSQNILAVALSLLPSEKCYPADRTDLTYLEQIVKWYRNVVVNVNKAIPKDKNLEKLLEFQIRKKESYNKKMLVYIFIAIMRSLGIQCRLVLSFQVEPLRPPSNELCSLSTKNETVKASTSQTKTENINISATKNNKNKESKTVPQKNSKEKDKIIQSKKEGETSKTKVKESKNIQSTSKQSGFNTRKPQNSTQTKGKQKKKSIPQIDGANDTDEFLLQVDGANDGETSSKPNLKKLKTQTSTCAKAHPKRLKTTITKYKDTDSEEESTTRNPFSDKNKDSPFTNNSINLKKLKEFPKVNGVNLKKLKDMHLKTNEQPGQSKFFRKNPVDVRSDIINLVKNRIKEQKQIDYSKMVKKKKKRIDRESDENSDYAPEAIKKKRPDSDDELSTKHKIKRRIPVKPEEQDKIPKKEGMDVWTEVFLESEEKWISVDVVKGKVHCIKEIYDRASHPVSYIVAWNNNNRIKDITRRYCQNFNIITRKLRVDSKWWDTTLKPYLAPNTAKEREEDEEFERQQLEKPLPNSMAEYKNHPLYVLKRHLLKFQAIYPPETPPLGFFKNEPVYARQCVHTLHSREVWLKHAKVVKPGEEPYKIVKARARYDKLSNTRITDQTVEIFGAWQTEDYVPPTAENGVVPRNAYGNVELFKPCMLPKKTVHLQLPGLNKIAKRLDIDCAPAVVGFDFHSGGSHPTFDGFVVCEEYADTLIAAWELEQEELAKKEREKVEKRVYGNWKKLIKGLLIRERLKAKYDFGEFSGKGKKKAKGGSNITKKQSRCNTETE